MRVDVGSMTLAPAIKRDLDVADVWVEVDLLGLAEASQLRTKRMHKSSANLNFGFSTSVTVAAGSKQQEVLKSALASKQEQDADVYFVVKTLTARRTVWTSARREAATAWNASCPVRFGKLSSPSSSSRRATAMRRHDS